MAASRTYGSAGVEPLGSTPKSQVLNLGLQDGLVVPGLGGTLLASRLPADAEAVDWEAALKRQNAANDELCSENSQLQLEVQRLAAEESREAWEDETEDQESSWLDELISKVQEAASSTAHTDEGKSSFLARLLSCLDQAIRAADTDEAAGATTMAEEV
ncbi:unnamed protein product, partial [Durusdinium trenchii]